MGRFTDSGRGVARRVLTPVAALLLRLKVSPDAVTVIGTLGTSTAALVGGLLVSYARARAEGLGADASAGIAERTERLVLTLAAAGLSGIFDAPWLLDVALWLVAALSWITVFQRIWAVRRQLLPTR